MLIGIVISVLLDLCEYKFQKKWIFITANALSARPLSSSFWHLKQGFQTFCFCSGSSCGKTWIFVSGREAARMIFNSAEFLIFYPLVLLLYFVLPKCFKWPLLLIASCFFYMIWNPPPDFPYFFHDGGFLCERDYY